MEMLPGQPLPVPSSLTRPFWDECRQHRLSLQRCVDCSRFRFYPTAACPHCSSPGSRWEAISGRGTVYSWIVVDRTHDPYWRTRVPYICAIVELDEQKGLFMPGLLIDLNPSDVRAAMAVEVVFEDVAPAISLPRWKASGG